MNITADPRLLYNMSELFTYYKYNKTKSFCLVQKPLYFEPKKKI